MQMFVHPEEAIHRLKKQTAVRMATYTEHMALGLFCGSASLCLGKRDAQSPFTSKGRSLKSSFGHVCMQAISSSEAHTAASREVACSISDEVMEFVSIYLMLPGNRDYGRRDRSR
jgi:hypothetical protein